jgi:hypothetical protein
VAGDGIQKLADVTELERVEWRKIGPDLMLQARIKSPRSRRVKRAA